MATRSARSSQREKAMGSQEPSERIAPEYRATDGPDAVRILRAGGTVLDPWQSDILDDWMGRTVSGKWSAPTAGGSVPRQNGKSLLVQGRAEAGMLLFNETVIYTAHLQKTATETFEEMRAFFESPKLRRHVAEIKTALGREQIILKSGARIKFLARTRNGGRGQHGDLLIFDEAQELDETAQGSFLPAISASLNPQTIYVGTPPGPDAVGTVFRALRRRALDGDAQKAAWFEFSVPESTSATVKEGAVLGTATVYLDCYEMGTVDLVTHKEYVSDFRTDTKTTLLLMAALIGILIVLGFLTMVAGGGSLNLRRRSRSRRR